MYQSALTAEEAIEDAYIKACGEKGAETIVDGWMDGLPFLDADTKSLLRDHLLSLLWRDLTDLEKAQGAALAVGNPDYETWRGGQ